MILHGTRVLTFILSLTFFTSLVLMLDEHVAAMLPPSGSRSYSMFCRNIKGYVQDAPKVFLAVASGGRVCSFYSKLGAKNMLRNDAKSLLME